MNILLEAVRSKNKTALHILSSGSKGNCCCIETEKELVFIDAGVGAKRLCEFIRLSGKKTEDCSFFITHEHGDHISGLKDLCRWHTPNIFASEGTANCLLRKGIPAKNLTPLRSGGEYRFASFAVSAFKTHHDSHEPFGYTITAGGKVFGILTDCGMVTKDILASVEKVNILILEANYDPVMLANGPYHKDLKKRIASGLGHLSNNDACQLLANLAGGALEECHFGHVSETNNDYGLLERLAGFCEETYGMKVDVLRQKTFYSYVSESGAEEKI